MLGSQDFTRAHSAVRIGEGKQGISLPFSPASDHHHSRLTPRPTSDSLLRRT